MTNNLKRIHEASLLHVSQWTGPYDVTLYRITVSGESIDLSRSAMKQLATFMADFTRESADATFQKRAMYDNV